MPASHHSIFYRPDALHATQPTASKHWRYVTTGWHKFSVRSALPLEDLDTVTHLIKVPKAHLSLPCQTASQSVQQLLHSSFVCPTHKTCYMWHGAKGHIYALCSGIQANNTDVSDLNFCCLDLVCIHNTNVPCCFQMGALATCQTNVACLLELADAMHSGTNVDRAEEKIKQITGWLIQFLSMHVGSICDLLGVDRLSLSLCQSWYTFGELEREREREKAKKKQLLLSHSQ